MSLKKTATIEKPHATFVGGDWTYHVLKTYQTPAKERANQYAAWVMAVKSPHTFGSYDMGDTYIRDVVNNATCVWATREFADAYPEYEAQAVS